MFNQEIPMERLVRGEYVCTTQYGFGNASGSGFGALWEDQGREKKYWKGTWENNMAGKSSDLCELKNLAETLEILAR